VTSCWSGNLKYLLRGQISQPRITSCAGVRLTGCHLHGPTRGIRRWNLEARRMISCVDPGKASMVYHWTVLRRPLRATVPSIILCVKKWNRLAPQRRGSPHSGEGQNGRFHLITTEGRGYKKIPLVEFQDIHKTDLQNLFRPNWVILRGVLPLVTQIPSGT